MKQFVLGTAPGSDGFLTLSGPDYHYLVHVRRLASGETFSARLPNGDACDLKVEKVTKEDITLAAIPPPKGDFSRLPPPFSLILFQALPKAPKFDLIIRQAAEAEALRIVPFVSEFSVPIVKADKAEHKRERWQKIAREARQQSGSAVATIVDPVVTFDKMLKTWYTVKAESPRSIALFFHQAAVGEKQPTLHETLADFPRDASTSGATPAIVYAIGPEGGFSDTEAASFLEAGFAPVLLGHSVLRVETAAIYAAGAIRTMILEHQTWTTIKN
jgi:16S rRNA (uracil1498-N3)-methyltransferase